MRALEENILNVSNMDDLKEINDKLAGYRRRLDEEETECKQRDSRLGESNHGNFNQRLDVDLNRRARSDFETENRNLSDLRES